MFPYVRDTTTNRKAIKMNAHIAAYRFTMLDRAAWDFWMGRGPEPKESDYGFRHGWISIDGQSYSRPSVLGPQLTYNGH